YGSDAGIKELETLASRFKSMDFISEKVKNNSIQSTLSVNFKDGEANALSQIFELLKQMNIIDGY
ncbi:MAG: hypothetical protein H7321_03835, partial [Bacteroidia bacterium]|nr:hypothetical protein [Bacteroidia bacterium]